MAELCSGQLLQDLPSSVVTRVTGYVMMWSSQHWSLQQRARGLKCQEQSWEDDGFVGFVTQPKETH